MEKIGSGRTLTQSSKGQEYESRGRIFSSVRPFYERAVSDQDRSMHRSLWV